jgi:hypothetical protein
MEGQPMREKTYHLYLNEEERSRVIQSLIELKNNLAAQGRFKTISSEIISATLMPPAIHMLS